MPQYWLKPLGTTDPPAPMRDDWLSDVDLDAFDLMTGPATPRKPPQIGRGDRLLLHAVIHVRMFAEAEILGNPRWREHDVWGLRFPWVYPSRVDVWVPRVTDGVVTTAVAPRKVTGRLQTGAEYAKLTAGEYADLLAHLKAAPAALIRDT